LATNPKAPLDISVPPRSRAIGYKSRHVAQLSNFPVLGRSAWMSRIQQVATQAPPDAEYPRLMAFLQFWKWIGPYLRDSVHEKAPYQTYTDGRTGIFKVAPPNNDTLRIAVAADWGTGTLEAETVANNMRTCSPHYTLHLGDVYYMGEGPEVEENCLGKRRNGYLGVHWPMGSLGSFALMGNHEMYSGGQGYFKDFLTTLGLSVADKNVLDQQSASFFCLEATHWRVLGLDTGYHSGGMPGLTSMPLVNSIPFLDVDARFDDMMVAWLKQTMAALPVKKPTLLLTHHQPVSSFQHAFNKPVKQLTELGFLNGQEFVWLYGHEHRLTIYNKQAIANSLTVYPRCIGHGGMPVEVTKVAEPDPRILYYDPRQHPIDDEDLNTQVGYNGHVVLTFEGSDLTIEYRDIVKNNLLLTETFSPGGAGALRYSSSKPPGSQLTR
jgi:hypothetical protein